MKERTPVLNQIDLEDISAEIDGVIAGLYMLHADGERRDRGEEGCISSGQRLNYLYGLITHLERISGDIDTAYQQSKTQTA